MDCIASEVTNARLADKVVLTWADTLIQIGHLFHYVATITCPARLRVGLKGSVELLISRTCQALAAYVEVASFTAREEELLSLIDRTVTNIAVEFTTVGLERTALHAPYLVIDKASFLNRVRILTANLGLLIHRCTTADSKVLVTLTITITG